MVGFGFGSDHKQSLWCPAFRRMGVWASTHTNRYRTREANVGSSPHARVEAQGNTPGHDVTDTASRGERTLVRIERLLPQRLAGPKQPAANDQKGNNLARSVGRDKVEHEVAGKNLVAMELADDVRELRPDA